ncbi:MAG: sodium:solute symporter family protein [Planctomycetota bacterium]|nr:sodium:solute symporter family protein [Planctomycetota bacterium]
MVLNKLDWLILVLFFAVSLGVGVVVARRAGRSSTDFFLSGRNMPWWLLGTSMVATTFSAGTPNFVTNLVREYGIAGNWLWWCFLPTGMLTTFLYAKLWRRSGVVTDIEFYELRYSGKPAAFLRGFRAVYLGLVFNIVGIATATMAAIKIAGVMLGAPPTTTVVTAGAVAVLCSMLGGLTGVLLTDFLLFAVSMGGTTAAAVVLLNRPEIGGLSGLLSHESVQQRLAFLPELSNLDLVVTLLVIPLAVQWWSVWYPGAEPGGGGYVVQRMLAARNESHATGATLLFNTAHYALRPWPWLIVALISVVLYPDLESLRAAFPDIAENVMRNDAAYPAALTLLPSGLRGLLLAALLAAYMSTVSTLLNLGSSYMVNDFYRRFVRPDADEKVYVRAGRASTLGLMILASLMGLWLKDALQAFNIMVQVGAGTGLLFLLRWFWWRINAFSELAAMISSLVLSLYFEFFHPEAISPGLKLVLCVGLTTLVWLAVTFLTRPTDENKLRSFCGMIGPGGIGWRRVIRRAAADGQPIIQTPGQGRIALGLLCSLLGCVAVYSFLLATGYAIYGRFAMSAVLTLAGSLSTAFLMYLWNSVAGIRTT